MALPDYGAEKPPPEYDIHTWKLFLKAVGNSRAGSQVTTTSGEEGFIEEVDERRNHVIFVENGSQTIKYVKLWHLKSFSHGSGVRKAPQQPR